MAVTAQSTGTLTATGGGVEDTLLDVAVAGTFTLHVDTNAMVAGDVCELRIYQIVLTGGTRRVAYYARFDGAQPTDDKIKISVPISNELTDSGSLRFTLEQSGAGTDKAFPWKVLKYA
jgi:hypothetical protein